MDRETIISPEITWYEQMMTQHASPCRTHRNDGRSATMEASPKAMRPRLRASCSHRPRSALARAALLDFDCVSKIARACEQPRRLGPRRVL